MSQQSFVVYSHPALREGCEVIANSTEFSLNRGGGNPADDRAGLGPLRVFTLRKRLPAVAHGIISQAVVRQGLAAMIDALFQSVPSITDEQLYSAYHRKAMLGHLERHPSERHTLSTLVEDVNRHLRTLGLRIASVENQGFLFFLEAI